MDTGPTKTDSRSHIFGWNPHPTRMRFLALDSSWTSLLEKFCPCCHKWSCGIKLRDSCHCLPWQRGRQPGLRRRCRRRRERQWWGDGDSGTAPPPPTTLTPDCSRTDTGEGSNPVRVVRRFSLSRRLVAIRGRMPLRQVKQSHARHKSEVTKRE